MCCGCCFCCRNRGKVHGYVGPPRNQPVAVTAIVTQPAPVCHPVPCHYPNNYPPATAYNISTPQPMQTDPPRSRELPPPYTETAPSAPGYQHGNF